MSQNPNLKKYFAPALLTLIALIQLFQVELTHLSPWKGGGFGMFAVIAQRSLTCEIIDQENNYRPCQVPFRGQGEVGPLTKTLRKSLINNPNKNKLDFIADQLFKNSMKVRLYSLNPQAPPTPQTDTAVKALRLSMWELKFDIKNYHVVMRPMKNLLVEKGDWSKIPFNSIVQPAVKE